MRPILLQIGGFGLHTYGVMLAVGFIVGIYLATHESDRLGLDTNAVLDLCYWILLSAIVGSRLFHVFVYSETYFEGPHPTLTFPPADPVFAMSLAAAAAFLLGSAVFLRRLERHPRGTDFLVPAVAAVGLAMVNAIMYSKAAEPFMRAAEPQVSPSYASPTVAFAVTAAVLIGLATALARPWRRAKGWLGAATFETAAAILGLAWVNLIAFHYEEFRKDAILDIFRIWKGGLTFYGGFLAAVVVSILFCKLNRMSFLRVADATSPSIMLGLAFGRLGCFSAGCCYGDPAPHLPWGVKFTTPQTLASPHGVSLHPTQIYESLAAVAVFLALTALKKRVRFPGGIFWTMLLVYAPIRFTIEFVRADPRGHLWGLSESQVVGIALFGLGAVGMLWSRLSGTGKAEVEREQAA